MTIKSFEAARGRPCLTLGVQKLNETATLPTYGSDAAAGMDLYANLRAHGEETVTLYSGERRLFKTGLAIACPSSTYGRIAPRSGLAYKSGVDVLAGVIDEDYRGDVGIILINHGNHPFVINHGDRIAQLIITPYCATFVQAVPDFDATSRGAGGFGSTGT